MPRQRKPSIVRRMNDSFIAYRRPNAAYLHPSSDTFGILDGEQIIRSFVANGRRLRSELLHLTDDLSSGDLTVQRFTVRARAFIRAAYFISYSLGATSIFPFYTLTERDVRVLDDELNEETGFLRNFARDISRGQLDLDANTRAGLYLLALRGIFERGRVEAMPPGPYRWRLGNTEHCTECRSAALDGPYQRDRTSGLGLQPLPGTPGDGSVCLGLTRCGCRIELSSGISLPNEDLTDRLRGLLLEIVHGSGAVA